MRMLDVDAQLFSDIYSSSLAIRVEDDVDERDRSRDLPSDRGSEAIDRPEREPIHRVARL